jgi:anti-sigma factor RsiW
MVTSDALTCRALADVVMDLLDGALPLAERAAFEAHVAACPDCAAYVASYRATVRLGSAHGGDDERPPEMPEDLVQSILAARRSKR